MAILLADQYGIAVEHLVSPLQGVIYYSQVKTAKAV